MIIIHYFSIVVSFSPPINLNKNTNPINRFTTSTKCACPKPGPAFQTSYVVGGFLCSASESERCLIVLLILVELLTITVYCVFCWYWWNCWPSLFIVRFVDIGEIIDYHYLNFLFIISNGYEKTYIWQKTNSNIFITHQICLQCNPITIYRNCCTIQYKESYFWLKYLT